MKDNWPPPHKSQDETLFVYRHPDNGALVYGLNDSLENHNKLIAKGYEHTGSLSGAIVMQLLINSGKYDERIGIE